MSYAKPARSDTKLNQIVKALKKEFRPERLFVFGSRANGTHRSDSDYDLVLVVPGIKNRLAAEVKARSLILDKFDVSADIFIYSKKDFNHWKNELSSIPETALNTGREINLGYSKNCKTMAHLLGSRPESGPEDFVDGIRNEIRRCFSRAKMRGESSEGLSRSPDYPASQDP